MIHQYNCNHRFGNRCSANSYTWIVSSFGDNFDGVTFDWTTARGPAYGQAAIYVDGALLKTVDLYNPTPQWLYKVTVAGLPYGSHTVLIKVLGTKNPASSGTGIVSDGFVIN